MSTTTAIQDFILWITGTTAADTVYNDTVDKLDKRLNLSVKSRTTDAQPGSPTEGDVYIITGAASGTDWVTFDENNVAIYRNGAWSAEAPKPGLPAWIEDDGQPVVFDGSSSPQAWTVTGGSGFLTSSDIDTFSELDSIVADEDLVSKSSIDTISDLNTIVADFDLTQFEYSVDVETVDDEDYVLWWDAPFPGEVTTVRTITQSGTCTVTGKIKANSESPQAVTALGGTVNSASTTAQEQTHSSSNTFAKGDRLYFTVSSNSSATDMSVIFYGART